MTKTKRQSIDFETLKSFLERHVKAEQIMSDMNFATRASLERAVFRLSQKEERYYKLEWEKKVVSQERRVRKLALSNKGGIMISPVALKKCGCTFEPKQVITLAFQNGALIISSTGEKLSGSN